jgi:hypothetical protein
MLDEMPSEESLDRFVWFALTNTRLFIAGVDIDWLIEELSSRFKDELLGTFVELVCVPRLAVGH